MCIYIYISLKYDIVLTLKIIQPVLTFDVHKTTQSLFGSNILSDNSAFIDASDNNNLFESLIFIWYI